MDTGDHLRDDRAALRLFLDVGELAGPGSALSRACHRRFTRLTNVFSKKIENHEHAIAICFAHYDFVRIHQTLRCSSATEAGVTDRLCSMNDMVAMTPKRKRIRSARLRTNRRKGTDFH